MLKYEKWLVEQMFDMKDINTYVKQTGKVRVEVWVINEQRIRVEKFVGVTRVESTRYEKPLNRWMFRRALSTKGVEEEITRIPTRHEVQRLLIDEDFTLSNKVDINGTLVYRHYMRDNKVEYVEVVMGEDVGRERAMFLNIVSKADPKTGERILEEVKEACAGTDTSVAWLGALSLPRLASCLDRVLSDVGMYYLWDDNEEDVPL